MTPPTSTGPGSAYTNTATSGASTGSGGAHRLLRKSVKRSSPAKTDPQSSQWRLRRVQSIRVARVDVWERYVDPESQAPFYYNTLTEQTQWEVPEDYDASAQAVGSPDARDGWKAIRDRSVCLSSSSSMYLTSPGAPTASAAAAAEPSGWEKYYDVDSERYFYHNAGTGESTWDNPEPLAATDPVSAWVECLDPNTNAMYYYNESTGESVWELPAGATLRN